MNRKPTGGLCCEWLFPLEPGARPGEIKVSMTRAGLTTVHKVRVQCRGVWMNYEVLSGKATLWRAVLGRFRAGTFAARSLLVSDG